jgi:hypothetical protein
MPGTLRRTQSAAAGACRHLGEPRRRELSSGNVDPSDLDLARRVAREFEYGSILEKVFSTAQIFGRRRCEVSAWETMQRPTPRSVPPNLSALHEQGVTATRAVVPSAAAAFEAQLISIIDVSISKELPHLGPCSVRRLHRCRRRQSRRERRHRRPQWGLRRRRHRRQLGTSLGPVTWCEFSARLLALNPQSCRALRAH